MGGPVPTWAEMRDAYQDEHGEPPPEETVALLEHKSMERGRVVLALPPAQTTVFRNDEPTMTVVGAPPSADVEDREEDEGGDE